MKTVFVCFIYLLPIISVSAVQPIPGGVKIQWDRKSNEVSYAVWNLIPPATNWTILGTTTSTNWTILGNIPPAVMFGVTAIVVSNGITTEIDVGVPHWPPSVLTPPNRVAVTATNGYVVDTNQWVKVSSDLAVFDDWMRFNVVSNGIRIDHKPSPLKPRLFIEYPVIQQAPLPVR